MKKYLLLLSCAVLFSFNINVSAGEEYQNIDTAVEEMRIISTLENDNRILDSEIERCEKKKKGWIAATVIGGVGVVSTGVAAGVQAGKISQEKAALQQKQSEYDDLKTKKDNLTKQGE